MKGILALLAAMANMIMLIRLGNKHYVGNLEGSISAENHSIMSGKRKVKKRKGRKRLAYGVIAVAFILLCFLTYFSLQQSNQPDQTNGDKAPQAAIVDHLSLREPNQTFVQKSTTILKKRFSVDYYDWAKLDVDFFKNFFSDGYGLIVLRVHSAITMIDGEEVIGLFTWEHYDPENVPAKYYQDVMDDRLVEAYFSEEERAKGERYFGITHKFVEEYGEFQNTVILMMGCNGLTYTSMAEAFVKKGAKVYVSWDERVCVSHTDRATVHLLQSLILHNRTIKQAVAETMEIVGPDPAYHNSTLRYHPPEAGNYAIPNLGSSLSTNVVAHTSPTSKAPKKSKYKVHK